ncbi:transposase [Endozoicomonas sp. YOMI1]|uniref:transposase n=1 Tax=Endozoicomonas sp. YOMI1 TaxID=2828739 RepID=UPI0021473A31|nr:transposase [Endozoicomonas sp. YOMI1]
MKRLGQKQRALSRKTKGRSRSAKAKRAIAKLHYRVSNQRLAVLHEVSDYLTANFRVITIEDLNVSGMTEVRPTEGRPTEGRPTEGRPTRNRKLARAVNDAGFGMLRQFIEYKAALRDCQG